MEDGLFNVHSELDENEKEEVREAFELFGTENGEVEVKNLNNVFMSLGYKLTKEVLRVKLMQLDTERRKTLDIEEVENLLLAQKRQRLLNERIVSIFTYISGARDGGIDFGKLRRIAVEVGLTLTNEELEEMITAVDSDDDSVVTLEDFFHALEPLRPSPA